MSHAERPLGPVEAGVVRSVVAARVLGLLSEDLHAAAIAAARASARAADEADTPGAAGYALAVLGKQLGLLGLDAKATARVLERVDVAALEAAVRAEVERGHLQVVAV